MLCLSRALLLCCTVFSLSLLAAAMPVKLPQASVKQMLGQKLMLDLRYYCDSTPLNGQCRTPMTQLPPELATLIRDHAISGVILFAENLTDIGQTIALNRDLQAAAAASPLGATSEAPSPEQAASTPASAAATKKRVAGLRSISNLHR